jgi:hypothetical protein
MLRVAACRILPSRIVRRLIVPWLLPLLVCSRAVRFSILPGAVMLGPAAASAAAAAVAAAAVLLRVVGFLGCGCLLNRVESFANLFALVRVGICLTTKRTKSAPGSESGTNEERSS